MGMNVSCPLVREPETYEDPYFDRDSVVVNHTKEIHEMHLCFTHDVIQNRVRSIRETAHHKQRCQHWEESVERLQKRYPGWTANDLLNLKGQFELFDRNGDCLLDFNEFNAAVDVIRDGKNKETREQLFRKADLNHYNSINFDEYLQLMHEIKAECAEAPAPVSPSARDPATSQRLGQLAEMDPFQQMCYNLF